MIRAARNCAVARSFSRFAFCSLRLMRRRWLPLWLIVCVLVSQIALARHVVFHTAAALAAASVDPERHHALAGQSDGDENGVCEQCLAFIAVDVALPALPVFAALAQPREWHFPPATPVAVLSVSRGPTRNRDPPPASVSFV